MPSAHDPGLVVLDVAVLACALIGTRPWWKPADWQAAPLELSAFYWFWMGVLTIELLFRACAPDVRENLRPYFGQEMPITCILAPFAAMQLCRDRRPFRRWALIGTVLLLSGLQLHFFQEDLERMREGNAARLVSDWQCVWTVAVPLVWVAVLLSPRVKRFCVTTGAAEEVRPC